VYGSNIDDDYHVWRYSLPPSTDPLLARWQEHRICTNALGSVKHLDLRERWLGATSIDVATARRTYGRKPELVAQWQVDRHRLAITE
jgi:hypothetical protein